MPYDSRMHELYNDANNESIDYDFYDLKDEGDSNLGVKSVEIKPIKKLEKNSTKQKTDILNTSSMKSDLIKCIAYSDQMQSSTESSSEESGIDSRSNNDNEEEIISDKANKVNGSRSSSSPTSDLTSITPRSMDSIQSKEINRNEKDDYDDLFEDDYSITNQASSSDENDDMKLLSNAVNHMQIHDPAQTFSPIMWPKHGRRNMTFSNEQMRQINRENDILMRKIMSYSKPRRSSLSTVHNVPQIKASSEINRSRRLKKIERENYIMLKRIRDVKPTQKMHRPRPTF